MVILKSQHAGKKLYWKKSCICVHSCVLRKVYKLCFTLGSYPKCIIHDAWGRVVFFFFLKTLLSHLPTAVSGNLINFMMVWINSDWAGKAQEHHKSPKEIALPRELQKQICLERNRWENVFLNPQESLWSNHICHQFLCESKTFQRPSINDFVCLYKMFIGSWIKWHCLSSTIGYKYQETFGPWWDCNSLM